METERSAEQGNQRRLLTHRAQLLRHLECDQAAKAVAADVVGATGLNLANLIYIVRRHLLDSWPPEAFSVETLRFEPVEGLVLLHLPRQAMQEERAAGASMHAKESGSGSIRLDRDQSRITCGAGLRTQLLRQLLNGRSLKER